MERPVYNLEFRHKSLQMTIGDYCFARVPNYHEQHAKLQHLVNSLGAEAPTKQQTGEHALTAMVVGPTTDPAASIEWPNKSYTALDDVILLLQLFTGRDVFTYEPTTENPEPVAIIADPRVFPWGGVLACSLSYESGISGNPAKEYDATLENHLPKVYELISQQTWLDTYRGGYFLVLLAAAIKQQSLESAFTQCWTIWEHLFAVLNSPWMSNETIERFSSREKICNLLVHFGIRQSLTSIEKKRIVDLTKIRNRLVHFGQFPEKTNVYRDARMFVGMTEFICASALRLIPSNVFNTVEQFEDFLNRNTKGST